MFKYKVGQIVNVRELKNSKNPRPYPFAEIIKVFTDGSAVALYPLHGKDTGSYQVSIVRPDGRAVNLGNGFDLEIPTPPKLEIGKTYPSKGGRMAKVVAAYEENFMVAYLPDEFHLTGAGLVKPDGTSLKCLSMDLIL